MRELQISADQLIESLLNLPSHFQLCLLDSCGVSHLNSHLLVAGFCPVEVIEIKNETAEKTLAILDKKLSQPELSAIFTISYDFGLKLNQIQSRHQNTIEPDVFLALFDVLIYHDYDTKKTFLTGRQTKFDEIEGLLFSSTSRHLLKSAGNSQIKSNFTKKTYINAVRKIQKSIRCGNTYQTNLTQQISAELPDDLVPEMIFRRLRKSNPAPFSSFIRRQNDVVISSSPERFFKVQDGKISTSPIKGTRPRGKTKIEDSKLKNELITSEKDLAENVMIVDLLRNDLGRICEFGSVNVEKLFDLEEHPTLFHLVSTVSGKLRVDTKFSDFLRATFPCGSITGAPKIRTMQIIDQIEAASRGLSMGAIGLSTVQNVKGKKENLIDLSVAIRTMVVRENKAVFNVGGGIVIDSLPENEYEETLVKARALLAAIGASNQGVK